MPFFEEILGDTILGLIWEALKKIGRTLRSLAFSTLD